MRLFFVFIVVGVAAAWRVSAQSFDPETIRAPTVTPQINLGKMTFQAFCQACHGVKASGTENGPSFLNQVYNPGHHSDAAFYMAPLKGAQAHHWGFGDMPPVDGIKEAQLKNIIAYVRALQIENGFR